MYLAPLEREIPRTYRSIYLDSQSSPSMVYLCCVSVLCLYLALNEAFSVALGVTKANLEWMSDDSVLG